MRLLFVGDVLGRAGRAALSEHLPGLRARWRLDVVVVNGENAAGGFGITEPILTEFLDAGADAVTLGNHAFDQKEAMTFIERQPRLIRPANYPPGAPGRGAAVLECRSGARALVVNLMGRLFMDALDDPFRAADAELARARLWAKPATSPSWISTPRRRARSRRSASTSTAAPASSSAPTPMCPQRTSES